MGFLGVEFCGRGGAASVAVPLSFRSRPQQMVPEHHDSRPWYIYSWSILHGAPNALCSGRAGSVCDCDGWTHGLCLWELIVPATPLQVRTGEKQAHQPSRGIFREGFLKWTANWNGTIVTIWGGNVDLEKSNYFSLGPSWIILTAAAIEDPMEFCPASWYLRTTILLVQCSIV